MTILNDEKLNKILAEMSGQGPVPWGYLRDRYTGKMGRRSERFARTMMSYARRWPNRIALTRPHNVSEEPTVEILNAE